MDTLQDGTDLMKTGVLDVIRGHSLLSLDLHTYVHPDCSWHSRLICSLVCLKRVRHNTLTSVPFKRDKHLNCLSPSSVSVTSPLTRLWLSVALQTHPGYTRRPSLRSECALQWWSGPGSHRSRVWISASRGIWCHHPRPTHVLWCGRTSCGTH